MKKNMAWNRMNEIRNLQGLSPIKPKVLIKPPERRSSLATQICKSDCIKIISNGSPKK